MVDGSNQAKVGYIPKSLPMRAHLARREDCLALNIRSGESSFLSFTALVAYSRGYFLLSMRRSRRSHRRILNIVRKGVVQCDTYGRQQNRTAAGSLPSASKLDRSTVDQEARRLGLVVSTTNMLPEPIRQHGPYRGPSDYVRSAYEVAQRQEAHSGVKSRYHQVCRTRS